MQEDHREFEVAWATDGISGQAGVQSNILSQTHNKIIRGESRHTASLALLAEDTSLASGEGLSLPHPPHTPVPSL